MGAGSLFGGDPRKQEEGSWVRQGTVAAVGSGGPCPDLRSTWIASVVVPRRDRGLKLV